MSEGSMPEQGGAGTPGGQPFSGGASGYGYPGAPAAGSPYAGQAGAHAYPQQVSAAGGGSQALVVIGDITVASDGIVTPAGVMPRKGAVWTVTDMSRTEEKIPTYAIILAVVFAVFCLVGLFFLLMKEKTTTGHVQVTVNSSGRFHSTMIPVQHPMVVHQIMDQVNYARSVSV